MMWQNIAVGIIMAAAVLWAVGSIIKRRKNPCHGCGKECGRNNRSGDSSSKNECGS